MVALFSNDAGLYMARRMRATQQKNTLSVSKERFLQRIYVCEVARKKPIMHGLIVWGLSLSKQEVDTEGEGVEFMPIIVC